MTTNSSSDSAAAKAMAALLKSSSDLVMRAARRVNLTQLTEEEQRRYSEEEQRQMNVGFAALFIEALDGTGDPVRSMIIDTLIPGLVAKGESADVVIRWQSAYMVAIACEMLCELPPEHHVTAGDWLCRFSGDYVRDVARSASDAGRSG